MLAAGGSGGVLHAQLKNGVQRVVGLVVGDHAMDQFADVQHRVQLPFVRVFERTVPVGMPFHVFDDPYLQVEDHVSQTCKKCRTHNEQQNMSQHNMSQHNDTKQVFLPVTRDWG